VELDPNYILGWISLGTKLLEVRRLDESLETYRRALQIDPNNSKVIYYISCIYALKGDKPNAPGLPAKSHQPGRKMAGTVKTDTDYRAFWQDEDFIKITGGPE